MSEKRWSDGPVTRWVLCHYCGQEHVVGPSDAYRCKGEVYTLVEGDEVFHHLKDLATRKGTDVKARKGWDAYFMGLASYVAVNSKCASRSVGAVIVKRNRVVSTGYNGPPSGILPCWEAQGLEAGDCPRKVKGYSSGEGLEHCPATHAEVNAIVTAARMGVAVELGKMYVAGAPLPCKSCAGAIINAGIVEVICGYCDTNYDLYIDVKSMLDQAGVSIRTYE